MKCISCKKKGGVEGTLLCGDCLGIMREFSLRDPKAISKVRVTRKIIREKKRRPFRKPIPQKSEEQRIEDLLLLIYPSELGETEEER
jgi:hypothetical protein